MKKNFSSNDIPKRGLSLRNAKCFVHVEQEIFPHRVDLLHGCSTSGFLGDPLIMTPDYRRAIGVKGFTRELVETWLAKEFLPNIERRRLRNSALMFDQSTAHNRFLIRDLFEDMCPETYGGILWQPPELAKFISPLDNGVHSILENEFRMLLHRTDFSVDSMLECLSNSYSKLLPFHFQQFFKNCEIGY